MNKIIRNTLLATAGAALAAQTASATNTYNAYGDVLLEVKQVGAGSDLIVDLGNISQFSNGSSFDLSTKGYSAAYLTSVFGSSVNLSTLDWTVISAVNTATPKSVAVTDEAGLNGNVNPFGNNAAANIAASSINNSGGAYAAIQGASILSPTAVKISTSTAGSYTADGDDVNGSLNGEATVLNSDFSGTATAVYEEFTGAGNPTQLGTFNFNEANGDITYNASAVPEPSTYGMLAGFGLLALALRRQLVRGNAA
jgi:hypothetical protein